MTNFSVWSQSRSRLEPGPEPTPFGWSRRRFRDLGLPKPEQPKKMATTVSKELTWRLTFIQSHHAKIKFGPLLKVNIIFLFPHIGSSPFLKTKFLFFTQLQCQLCPFILFFCCCCCCCSCCCFVHQVMALSRPPLSIYIQLCSWCRTQSGK